MKVELNCNRQHWLILTAFVETYECFARRAPLTNLGMHDSKATSVIVELDGRAYEIRQSPGLLTSSRSSGTTGAALWKVSIALAEWIVDANCSLWTTGILNSNTTVVELGCGVAGLIGICLAPRVSSYILTDQDYVMKVLRDNVEANYHSLGAAKTSRSPHKSKAHPQPSKPKLRMLPYDWENDHVSKFDTVLAPNETIDVVIICDCIYNEFLIEPLISTCRDICENHPCKRTILLIAQQLRTEEILQLWLEELNKHFDIWRVKEAKLPSSLDASAGFAVHLATLKNNDAETVE